MKDVVRSALAQITGTLLLAGAAHASAAEIVSIRLIDGSGDGANREMTLMATPSTVKTGRVSFDAVNESQRLVHEVIVAPDSAEPMPYDSKRARVNERSIHALGEIPDLKPGTRGKVTMSLKPGTYVLFCNEPGHYHAGMYTKIVIEK